MVWKSLKGGSIPSDAVKLSVPGKTNPLGSLVVSPADLRPYRVVQAGSGEPSLDSDNSHYVPLGEETAIEAYIDIVDIPAPTLPESNVIFSTPVPDRSDYSGAAGYEFTINEPKTLVSMSRFIGSTFAQDHDIVIWNTVGQVAMASVTVTPSSPVIDGHAEEKLDYPVTLPAGTYRIVSEEFSGGDNWQDIDPIPSYSSDISITGAVADGVGAYPSIFSAGAGKAYVWPGMRFHESGVVIRSLPPTMGRNDYNGTVGYQFTTTEEQTLLSLSRPIGSIFAQSHEIAIWRVSDGSKIATATVDQSSRVIDGFAVESLIIPFTLAADTYRIASYEYDAGDNWENYTIPPNYSDDITIDGRTSGTLGVSMPDNFTAANGEAHVWPGMEFRKSDNVIESIPVNMDRNDHLGTAGYIFTIDEPQVLLSLSRPVGGIFNQSHQIGVWKDTGQILMAEVTVTPSSTVVDGFAVEYLATPVILAPGKYKIASLEYNGGDNWESGVGSIPTSYSNKITIVGRCSDNTVFDFPSFDTADGSAHVWQGMEFLDESAVNLYIGTSGNQPFEIDWDNGGGFVEAQSLVELWGRYPEAKASGTITLRFPEGVLPTYYVTRHSSSTSLKSSSEQIAAMNKYNSLTTIALSAGTTEFTDPNQIFRDGSALKTVEIKSTRTGAPNVDWTKHLSKTELDHLYLNIDVNHTGIFDFDDFDVDPLLDYIRLVTGGLTYIGNYSDFIARYPEIDYCDIKAKSDSTIVIDTNPPYAPELSYIAFDAPLTTPQVDKVLNGLATRSNPSWAGTKYVALAAQCAAPSGQGLLDIATIKAQTGSPSIGVNAQTRVNVPMNVAAGATNVIYLITSDGSDFEIDWGEGDGYETYSSGISLTKVTIGATTAMFRFAPGVGPLYLNFINGKITPTAETLVYLNALGFMTNVTYNTSLDYAITLDLDEITTTTYENFVINTGKVTAIGDIAAFINRNSLYYLRVDPYSLSTSEVLSVPAFESEIERIHMDYLNETSVDNILEGLATRSSPTWVRDKLVDLTSNCAPPSAAGLTHKTTIEGQTGSPSVLVNP